MKCKTIQVKKNLFDLNLPHNYKTSIQFHVFINLKDIIFLDLSMNKLENRTAQLVLLVNISKTR